MKVTLLMMPGQRVLPFGGHRQVLLTDSKLSKTIKIFLMNLSGLFSFKIVFPLSISFVLIAGSCITLVICDAISFGALGLTYKAASPNCSFAPGKSELITGQLKENASKGGRFSGPEKERYVSASAFLYKKTSCSCETNPR